MLRDGPLPGPLDIEAGALSFSRTTLTMLHRKSRLSSIDKHTGATRTFVNGLSFIQHLENELSHNVIQFMTSHKVLTTSGHGPR